MEEYHITLKNEKTKWYTTISLIAIITNTLVFLYISFSSADKFIAISCAICVLLIAACFAFNAWLERQKSGRKIAHYVMFLIITAQWLVLGFYEIALIPVFFSFLAGVTSRKLEVTIHKDRIAYPSFPLRNFRWSDISNVILKDGLLTIDLKNNRLIQQSIDEQQSSVNEKEFNEFCSQQLKTAVSN
jgi:hypothetical protein